MCILCLLKNWFSEFLNPNKKVHLGHCSGRIIVIAISDEIREFKEKKGDIVLKCILQSLVKYYPLNYTVKSKKCPEKTTMPVFLIQI